MLRASACTANRGVYGRCAPKSKQMPPEPDDGKAASGGEAASAGVPTLLGRATDAAQPEQEVAMHSAQLTRTRFGVALPEARSGR
jgi:hypothetical protein